MGKRLEEILKELIQNYGKPVGWYNSRSEERRHFLTAIAQAQADILKLQLTEEEIKQEVLALLLQSCILGEVIQGDSQEHRILIKLSGLIAFALHSVQQSKLGG